MVFCSGRFFNRAESLLVMAALRTSHGMDVSTTSAICDVTWIKEGSFSMGAVGAEGWMV